MKNICTQTSICGKENSFLNRYCVNCGRQLKSHVTWGNSCANLSRTSSYNGFATDYQLKEVLSHELMPQSFDVRNNPQAILIYDNLWFWGNDIITLYQFDIAREFDTILSSLINASDYRGCGEPTFSSTPAFDGIGVDFIHDGKFTRVSAFNGKIIGRILEDPAFNETQRCTPVVAEYESNEKLYKTNRYWITCLKKHLLIVDVRFVQEEDYHLIPWRNENDDEARSPVIYKDHAYVVSRNGKIFRSKINAEFKSHIKNQKQVEEIVTLENDYCFAPMLINGHIVFQTLSKTSGPSADNHAEDWREIGYASYHIDNESLFTFPTGEYAKLSTLESLGHLSGLSDGYFAYFSNRSSSKYHYVKFTPGQKPLPKNLNWKESNTRPPGFSTKNTIIYNDSLIVLDSNKKRIVKWSLKEDKGAVIDSIPIINNSNINANKLISQPLVFGDILLIIFDNHIVKLKIRS